MFEVRVAGPGFWPAANTEHSAEREHELGSWDRRPERDRALFDALDLVVDYRCEHVVRLRAGHTAAVDEDGGRGIDAEVAAFREALLHARGEAAGVETRVEADHL